jgi:HD-like signal output (HDOD) protein
MPTLAPIEEHLAARILACPGLPTLPAVAVHVLDLCEKDEVDLAAIAAAVSHDPAITAKLLRLANSASFATRGKVASLAKAVALLGTNATLGVTLSFSLIGGRRRLDARGFDHSAFWRRALFSAIAGRALGRIVEHDQDDAFVACLLQDLGMLALNEVFPSDYGQVCLAADTEHEALPALESELLGVDHVQVGGLLARRWNLPERLQEAIGRSHGPPERSPGPAGLALHHAVFLSGRLAEVWISARPPEATRAALGAAADQLGLSAEVVSAALQRMAAAVPEASADFDLDLGGPDRVQAVLAEAKRLLGTRRAAGAAPGPDPWRLLPLEAFRHVAAEEVERARRGGRPSALLVIRAAAEGSPQDAELARTLQASLRQTDVLSREGGEYLALLVDTPERGALVVAERLRARLSAAGLDGAVGLACLPDAALGSAAQLLAAARAALEAEPGRSPP